MVGYTPHYASIEQMLGGGTEARSDIYSFSATMYRLLTGAVPPDAMSRVEATNDGRPDPLPRIVDLVPQVPAGLAAVVQKGMATAKGGRFASAREMRIAWTACAAAHEADDVPSAPIDTRSPEGSGSPDAATVRPVAAAAVVPQSPTPAAVGAIPRVAEPPWLGRVITLGGALLVVVWLVAFGAWRLTK